MKKLFITMLAFVLAISIFAFTDVSAASSVDYEDSTIKVESGTATDFGINNLSSSDDNYYKIYNVDVSSDYIEFWQFENVLYIKTTSTSSSLGHNFVIRDTQSTLYDFGLVLGPVAQNEYFKVTITDQLYFWVGMFWNSAYADAQYDVLTPDGNDGYGYVMLSTSDDVYTIETGTPEELGINDLEVTDDSYLGLMTYDGNDVNAWLIRNKLYVEFTTSSVYSSSDDIELYYGLMKLDIVIDNTGTAGQNKGAVVTFNEPGEFRLTALNLSSPSEVVFEIDMSYHLDYYSEWKIEYDDQVQLGEDLEVSVTMTSGGSGIQKIYEVYIVNMGSVQVDVPVGITSSNGNYAVTGETFTFTVNTSNQVAGDYNFNISRIDVEYQGANETLYPNLLIGNLTYTVVSAPEITLTGNANMSVEYDSTFVEPGATASDMEDGDLTSSISTSGTVDTSTLGNYTITYSVTDASGNTVTVDRIVSVVDSVGPVITLNGGANIDVFVDSTYTDAGASALDAYDGNVTDDIVATGTVNTAVAGSYFIVYTVVDSNGNAAEPVTRQVNVVDAAAPTISVTGDAEMTLEVGEAFVDPGATATDDTDGDLTSSIVVTGTVNINHVGIYTVYYNVQDSAGNAAIQKSRTVNVVDTTDPVAELVGDDPFYVEVGTDFVEPGISAIDAYDGDISNQVEITGEVNVNLVGTYVRTYVIEDAAGNSVILTRDVVVRDTTAPTIVISGTTTLNSEAVLLADLLTPSASDLYDGILTNDITVIDDEYTGNETRVGDWDVTFTVQDAAGNTASKTVTISVVDDLAPELTVSADFIDRATYDGMNQEDLMNYLAGTYIPGNVGDSPNILVNDLESPWAIADINLLISASDAEDGDITEDITILNDGYTGHEDELGEFLITYAVQDSGNQTTQIIITVINQDFLSPVISYDEDALTVPKDGTMTLADLQLVVIDNIDGDITNESVISGWSGVDLTTIGSYEVQIDVVDASGNASQAILTITVVDDVAPVITGPDSFIKHPDFVFNAQNLLSYYTAEDNIDGDITVNIEMLSNELIGNADDPGTYNIVLRVEDAAGNTTLKEITVQVDAELPVYLVVDEAAEIVVDSEAVLESSDFINLLIHIDVIQDKVYIPTTIQDTYTESFDTEGTYDYDVTLNSADGTEYSIEVDIVVSDGNVITIPGVIVVPDDYTGIQVFGYPWYYAGIALVGIFGVGFLLFGKKK